MRLYIDEDMINGLLIRLLERAGHDVQVPASVGIMGRTDPQQLRHAIREDRVCLTANHEDFEDLHLLIIDAKGSHPGILVVRQENNPARDLTPKGIVAAIRNLEAASAPIANECVVLNHWR